jgi:TonB family protein
VPASERRQPPVAACLTLLLCVMMLAASAPFRPTDAGLQHNEQPPSNSTIAPPCWAGTSDVPNPYARKQSMPLLPPELAMRKTDRRSIILKLCIDASGRVDRAIVLSSTGDKDIDDFFRLHAAKWKFKPARKNGKAIPSVVKSSTMWNVE